MRKFLKILIIVILGIGIYLGIRNWVIKNSKISMFLKTSDNIKIAYDFYPADKPQGYLVLVHMMPADKESWKDFAKQAQRSGYTSIAIDLRGHGKSDGGSYGYREFSDTDHQKSILDLEAAVEFLKNQGARPENIYFIGASIGANLSLWYLAEHQEFKKAVLLSAGLNYRGIKTEPLYQKLKNVQIVLAVSSRDDGSNAAENERLFGKDFENLIIYDRGGHGTDLLKNNPDLTEKILNFLTPNT